MPQKNCHTATISPFLSIVARCKPGLILAGEDYLHMQRIADMHVSYPGCYLKRGRVLFSSSPRFSTWNELKSCLLL